MMAPTGLDFSGLFEFAGASVVHCAEVHTGLHEPFRDYCCSDSFLSARTLILMHC